MKNATEKEAPILIDAALCLASICFARLFSRGETDMVLAGLKERYRGGGFEPGVVDDCIKILETSIDGFRGLGMVPSELIKGSLENAERKKEGKK